MGRPRKENPKSHRQSQLEHVERMKQELGEEVYNAGEAERKRKSRKRVWESLDEDEKDRCRAFQRARGARYRKEQRSGKASCQSASNEALSATDTVPSTPTLTVESNPPSPSQYVEVSSDSTPQTRMSKTGTLKVFKQTSLISTSRNINNNNNNNNNNIIIIIIIIINLYFFNFRIQEMLTILLNRGLQFYVTQMLFYF